MGRLIFVNLFAGVMTLATVYGLIQSAYWVLDTYGGLAFAAYGIGIIAVCLGIAVRVDIAKGRYRLRDVFRWPPIWLYSRDPSDKRP